MLEHFLWWKRKLWDADPHQTALSIPNIFPLSIHNLAHLCLHGFWATQWERHFVLKNETSKPPDVIHDLHPEQTHSPSSWVLAVMGHGEPHPFPSLCTGTSKVHSAQSSGHPKAAWEAGAAGSSADDGDESSRIPTGSVPDLQRSAGNAPASMQQHWERQGSVKPQRRCGTDP